MSFLDRLFNVALPRVRDFRGINPNSFDGRGNYNMGIKEQLIFPEIDYDKIDKVRGMDICFVTTANTDEESRELLVPHGRPVCEIRRDYCGQDFYENQTAEDRRSILPVHITDAKSVAGRMPIFASSVFAASASGSSPTRVRFRA